MELIRALLPLGLAEVGRMLDEEVERLAGPRHGRKAEGEPRRYRHGSNPGSVQLGGQRHPIRVPRVRDERGEVKLVSYAALHGSSGEVDEGLFRKVLRGISCRDYEEAVEAVPGAIGMSKSQVSREFKKATAAKLKEFQERDLASYDVVAVFMDGKTFADDQMVIALGVTMDGDKVFLGFEQTHTENGAVITSFLRSLKDRGLDLSAGALVVVDGAKGLHSGALGAFPGQVLIQRCQWHERENVTSYLPKKEQKQLRKQLQRAYERPTYEEAKRGPEGDPGRARRGEPVRGEESGRRVRGVAHLPPARRLCARGPIPQDHQRDRVRPQHGRAALRPGGPLEELQPEAPLARDGPAQHRAPAPEAARLPAPPASARRDPEGTRDHPSRWPRTLRCLSRGSLQFQLALGLPHLKSDPPDLPEAYTTTGPTHADLETPDHDRLAGAPRCGSGAGAPRVEIDPSVPGARRRDGPVCRGPSREQAGRSRTVPRSEFLRDRR